MSSYTPSTVPGCRTPHFRRGDGSSLYDAMGPEFTLLRFDADADVTALEATAHDRGLPLKLLDVDQPDPVTFYDGSGADSASCIKWLCQLRCNRGKFPGELGGVRKGRVG
jgi:hypothetical protein